MLFCKYYTWLRDLLSLSVNRGLHCVAAVQLAARYLECYTMANALAIRLPIQITIVRKPTPCKHLLCAIRHSSPQRLAHPFIKIHF